MRAVVSISREDRCGLAAVCQIARVSRSSVYAQRRDTPVPVNRRGPKTQWSDAQLVEQMRSVLEESPFVGEGYRTRRARVPVRGIGVSDATNRHCASVSTAASLLDNPDTPHRYRCIPP